MSVPTHRKGIEAAQAIAAEFEINVVELWSFASRHLIEVHPDLEEVGTSDVSIHLAHLGNHEVQVLTTEAERIRDRNAVVKRVAESTGRSEEETLANLRRMFAPIED